MRKKDCFGELKWMLYVLIIWIEFVCCWKKVVKFIEEVFWMIRFDMELIWDFLKFYKFFKSGRII